MKKLLSLLSVLTISGTAMPTVIAASPYQKQQESKLIQNFNRIKRQINSLKNEQIIINSSENSNYGIENFIFNIDDHYYINNCILLNKKIYFTINAENFGKSKIYEYNPQTKETTKIIEKNDIIISFISLNNKLYFSLSSNGKIYEYNLQTKETKNVLTKNTDIRFDLRHIAILNDKVYFGSTFNKNKIYEYNLYNLSEEKIIETNTNGINEYFVTLNDKLYFVSRNNGKIYEYNPQTKETKEIIKENYQINSIVTLNDKLYLSSRINNKVYEYDVQTKEIIILKDLNEVYSSSEINKLIVLDNKLYFIFDNKIFYEYAVQAKEILVKKNGLLFTSLNNKLFYYKNNKLYENWSFDSIIDYVDNIVINDQTHTLLKNWKYNYDSWKKDISRQEIEDIPSFTLQQKNVWLDNIKDSLRTKIHSFLQDLVIIENYENIKNLKEDINKIKNQVNVYLNKEDNCIDKIFTESKTKAISSGAIGLVDSLMEALSTTIIGGVAGLAGGPGGVIVGSTIGLLTGIAKETLKKATIGATQGAISGGVQCIF